VEEEEEEANCVKRARLVVGKSRGSFPAFRRTCIAPPWTHERTYVHFDNYGLMLYLWKRPRPLPYVGRT
jgi:hypothetical protein